MNVSLVVGLGNPGEKYENTRHNIGFMVLDELAKRMSLEWKSAFRGEYALVVSEGRRYYLLKPMTYMNLSGESVSDICRYFKIPTEDVVIVHDELDYEFTKFKYRVGGSAGGHNGIISLIQHLKTEEFLRLRMGIAGLSRSKIRGNTVNYVIGNFAKEEQEALPSYVSECADSLEYLVKNGLEKTMQKYNRNK